jgi:nickel/cobalt transporter (NicO) family protein
LVAVGFAGGMVPSPSALLVLLGAIALGRTWYGLLLVVAYGLGMAATLTAAGLLLVRARAWYERRAGQRAPNGRAVSAVRFLPLATSSIIVIVGVTLAARAASAL